MSAARDRHLEADAKPRYQKALELMGRERKADLLMRLAEMNAWETAGRGDPGAYRQVEALMNRALRHGARDQPASGRAQAGPPNGASFHEGQGRGGRQGRIQDGVLVTALRLARDERNPKESDVPEAPRHPEYRVKQFVREYRLAKVTAAADRLHGVLCPMADQMPPAKEQIRDAVREACASRSQDEVNQLRDLYRERWLKGAKEGAPQDLDREIYAKLGNNIQLHEQCEASLNPAAAETHRSPGR